MSVRKGDDCGERGAYIVCVCVCTAHVCVCVCVRVCPVRVCIVCVFMCAQPGKAQNTHTLKQNYSKTFKTPTHTHTPPHYTPITPQNTTALEKEHENPTQHYSTIRAGHETEGEDRAVGSAFDPLMPRVYTVAVLDQLALTPPCYFASHTYPPSSSTHTRTHTHTHAHAHTYACTHTIL